VAAFVCLVFLASSLAAALALGLLALGVEADFSLGGIVLFLVVLNFS